MENISRLYALPNFTGRIKVIAGTEPAIAIKIKGHAVVDEAVGFVRAYAFASAPPQASDGAN